MTVRVRRRVSGGPTGRAEPGRTGPGGRIGPVKSRIVRPESPPLRLNNSSSARPAASNYPPPFTVGRARLLSDINNATGATSARLFLILFDKFALTAEYCGPFQTSEQELSSSAVHITISQGRQHSDINNATTGDFIQTLQVRFAGYRILWQKVMEMQISNYLIRSTADSTECHAKIVSDINNATEAGSVASTDCIGSFRGS